MTATYMSLHELEERVKKLELNHMDQLSPYAFMLLQTRIEELQMKLNTFIEFTKVVNDKKPHKCPVCEGKGLVFLMMSITESHQALCQPCEGSGIIWG